MIRWWGGASFALVMMALGRSALAAPAPVPAPGWSDADRQAVAYATAKAAGARTLTIDLSDPKMALFLKRHFEIAGMTEARYPGLHQLLKQNAILHATQGVAGPKVTALSEDVTYEDLATLMLALFPTQANTYQAMAVASMQAASADPDRNLQIAYSSLCFYDANDNPIGACQTQSAFGAGQYFPVNANVTTGAKVFKGVFSATYNDVTNKRFVAQMSVLTVDAIEYPSSQTISHPVIVNAGNAPLKTALVCTSRAVNANANPGTCDYGTYQTSNVLVNMEGSVVYAADQTPQVDAAGHLVGSGSIALINTSQGGQCRLAPTASGKNFYAQPEVSYVAATKTLKWKFNNLNFGNATKLICGGDGTNIQFSLLLQASDTGADTNAIIASQLSQPGVTTPHLSGPNAGLLVTPMLRLVAGCLDPETRVLLADGTEVPIASIRGEGDKLRAAEGARSQVVGTVVGKDHALYAIDAQGGLHIRATAQHPFVMADGSFRAAADLKVGDAVLTLKGRRRITANTKVAYEGQVDNLVLAHPGADFTMRTETFYANGFLVGGHDAQQKLVQDKLAAPARVRRVLPEAFRKDYESHLQDTAPH